MYQALYRKYRPKDFDSVVGQDSIIRTLRNSIIHSNFSHAYLFFGPRGTGKTTISKIFARNINCLHPNDGIACEVCEHCKFSFSKDCIDILEIDAASNNGVDEIRELKSKISLVPSELTYKVYIIDEVHMLTDSSFNALLKTLEEPPEHAIFILATTDPQKVPETIVSRCQCFSFKRLSIDVIKERLSFVCQKEQIEIEDEVLYNIALLSDGGMRDALGLLDKLTSYTNEKITMEDFVDVNGIITNLQLKSFISSIMEGNISKVLKDINFFDNSGKNLIQIFNQILNYSRDLIVNYYLENQKLEFSLEKFQIFTNLLNEKMINIKQSDNTRIFIEMFVLKFINDFILDNKFSETNVNTVTKNQVSSSVVEKKSSTTDRDDDLVKEFSNHNDGNDDTFSSITDEKMDRLTTNYEEAIPIILNISDIMKVRVNNTLALANKSLLQEETKKFELLKEYTFDQNIGYIVCSLLDSKIRVVSESNIVISFPYQSNVKQNLIILDKITDVYHKITNSLKNFAIITDNEWDKIKNDYISNLKNGIKYVVEEEPNVVLEESPKNDILVNSAVELFGDIVEIE